MEGPARPAECYHGSNTAYIIAFLAPHSPSRAMMTPRVARIVYWYFPDSELAQYQQPNLTEIGAWWRRARPVPAECF